MTESTLKPRRGMVDTESAKRGLPFYVLILILLVSAALLTAAWLLLPWIAEDSTAVPVGVELLNGSGFRAFAPMWLIPLAAFFLVYAAFPRILRPILQILVLPLRAIPAAFGIGSLRPARFVPPPISLPAARTAGILILVSLVYFLLYKGQVTRSLLEALAAIGIAYWVAFAVAFIALNIWRITPDMTGMFRAEDEVLERSENGLMPSESVLQRTLRARKTTASLWRTAFFIANIVGLFALVVLLLNILNQSFGYVLVNYTIKPAELSPNKPLEALSEPELARLFEDKVSLNRLRTITRDNLLNRQFSPTRLFGAQITQIFPEIAFDPERTDQTVSRALGAKPFPTISANERLTVFSLGLGIPRETLADQPISVAFAGKTFDAAIAEDTLREISIEKLAALLAANAPNGSITVDFLLGEPVKLLFANRTFRPEVADKRYEQLSATELIDLLEDNLDTAQLYRIIVRDVAQLRYDQTWTFLESVTNYDGILAQVQADEALRQGELRFHSWLSLDFITSELTASPATTGLRTSLLGSLWVIILTILIALPLGVGAAVYLEEYAEKNLLNAVIETNIRNLAGVPSIIYGMLGLAIFVRTLEQLTSGAFVGVTDSNGRTVISAAFTMALLILPVVIINAQEAIRAVPPSIREASYGVGATKWQTTSRQVLPAAFPGILTGLILSVSRAVGETAPLLVVGGLTFTLIDPNGPFSKFSVVPIQVYSWTADPAIGFRNVAAAAIIVLLVVLLTLNTTAIILRQRLSKNLRG
ncbi:MAG: phosphate ABC transporter permease PstA [Chloroflexi bacterium CFX4]|nr:phosphate ABC transporter permease PstA [Chloroflexi bacterium CFX4]MDL1920992.1 phosphate ABC transporter permease PstA [Chloroflexi bacterium CFX3]